MYCKTCSHECTCECVLVWGCIRFKLYNCHLHSLWPYGEVPEAKPCVEGLYVRLTVVVLTATLVHLLQLAQVRVVVRRVARPTPQRA